MAKKGFRFPGPVPRDALEFFRAKKLRPSFSYLDVTAEEHALQFTVAKSTGFDILGDVAEALAEHMENGGTLRTFERRLTPILQEKGWWGRETVEDPRTGDKVEVQLGSPRRLRTIFRSNMRSARAAGQWARIQRTKRTHPYLLYRLGPSRERRKEHVAWNGVLLPADDPWWRDHFTPNGWGCKCWIRQVSKAEYERLRREEGILTERPPRDEVEWTNPRTGKTVRVDRGLDPSWAGNPGRDRERILLDRMAAALAAATTAIPAAAAEALVREAVRRVVGSPLLDRQMAEPKASLPVALLAEGDARLLRDANGEPVQGRLAVLDPKGAKHIQYKHILPSHSVMTLDDARALLLAIPDGYTFVLSQTGYKIGDWQFPGTDLVYCLRDANGQWWKTIVRVRGGKIVIASAYDATEANILNLAAKVGKGSGGETVKLVRGELP